MKDCPLTYFRLQEVTGWCVTENPNNNMPVTQLHRSQLTFHPSTTGPVFSLKISTCCWQITWIGEFLVEYALFTGARFFM